MDKHATIKLAWAQGAIIERFIPFQGYFSNGIWTVVKRPLWLEHEQYRVRVSQ